MKERSREKIFRDIQDILTIKGTDYGKFDTSRKMGLYDVTVRMYDKVSRLQNLLLKKANGDDFVAVKDETIEDTIMDLIGYSILLLEAIEEREAIQKKATEARDLKAKQENKSCKGDTNATWDDNYYNSSKKAQIIQDKDKEDDE